VPQDAISGFGDASLDEVIDKARTGLELTAQQLGL